MISTGEFLRILTHEGRRDAYILGYPEDFVHAVLAHGWEYSGVKPETLCEKTLYTVDELTGFYNGCGSRAPKKSLCDLEVKSVKKSGKTRDLSRAVNRDVIERGSSLWESLSKCL